VLTKTSNCRVGGEARKSTFKSSVFGRKKYDVKPQDLGEARNRRRIVVCRAGKPLQLPSTEEMITIPRQNAKV